MNAFLAGYVPRMMVIAACALCMLIAAPALVHAQNPMCMGGEWDPSCPCNLNKNPKTGACDMPKGNKYTCFCMETANGYTASGKCMAPGMCKADKTSDGKGPDQGLSKLGEMLGKLMEMMKKAGEGGSESPQPNATTAQNCTTYQPTADRTLSTSNPCYYYQESVSSQLGDTGAGGTDVSGLLNSLGGTDTGTGGTNNTTISDILNTSVTTGTTTNTGGTNETPALTGDTEANPGQSSIGELLFTTPLNNLNKGTPTSGTPGGVIDFTTPQDIVQSIIQKTVQPGAYGDIKIMENGTTIVAGVREGGSETAGFFGVSGKSTQGQSTVAKLCQSRPWTTNFLSYIIPASFFDGLCTWRGYSVGGATVSNTSVTVPASTTSTNKTPTATVRPTPAATTTPAIPLRVDIWASPATVPIGARTSIFWNTEGAASCIETSPDGSFSNNSLKGGASTVPLTAATTFTISCTASDGTHATDSVTVLIAI